MSSEILSIEVEPGSITQTPLPSGAVRVTGRKFVPKPPVAVVSDFTVSDGVGLINITKAAKPGAVILLRGGTYKGNFVSQVSGTPDKPIVFRAYPGERVILDGLNQAQSVLTINGAHTYWRDIEITMSGAIRTDKMEAGANVFGAGTKLINCNIHDCGTGIGLWTPAVDAEVYGCLIYNNGYTLPDRKHGHGIYSQNDAGTKRIIDNIVFGNYWGGAHIYTEGGSIKGFHLEGNVCANNGAVNILVSGMKPAERIRLQDNLAYQPLAFAGTNVQLAMVAPSQDIELLGNYFAGASEVLWLAKWAKATAKNNTLLGATNMGRIVPRTGDAWDFSGNQYIGVGNAAPFNLGGGWRSVPNAAALGVTVFARPNKHEPGRAHLAVCNWSRQSSVSVDLSGALKGGDNFQVFNVMQSLQSPILTGVFGGAVVALPTPNEFQAFLIVKK